MNSFNYQTLSFNNADYSYGSNGSMQQSTSYLPQSVSKTCDYNCICCARFHVGNPCPCNTPKTSIGTQTDLEVPQGLDSERFWKRGTYEHSILQKSVHDVVQKYHLSGKADASWEQATSEIMISFTKDMPQTSTNRQKIQQRMKKAIYWLKFYGKKKTQAMKDGQKSVFRFLCKSRKEKSQTTPAATSTLFKDAHDIGADNRGDDTLEVMMSTPPSEDDDSSDSDVPLSTYIRKGKTKKGQ